MIMENVYTTYGRYKIEIRLPKYELLYMDLDKLPYELITIKKDGKELKFTTSEFWKILDRNTIGYKGE